MEYKGYKLRHEFKFYINAFVYHELRERLRYVLQTDRYMRDEEGYLISSLYFDDIYQSAMNEKINGTDIREKYRIRLYNHSDNFIKLECKSKFNDSTSKQSASISRKEYDYILKGEYDFLKSRPEELCRKLYVNQKTKLLKPITVVEYLREAYVNPLGNVRITFDKNLSASIGDLDVFHMNYETKRVPMESMMILEVKYDDYIPDYIWKIIQTDNMVRCAISKFVMCRDINRKVRKI